MSIAATIASHRAHVSAPIARRALTARRSPVASRARGRGLCARAGTVSPVKLDENVDFYQVRCMIRPWRLNDVVTALENFGIRGLTTYDVMGAGVQAVDLIPGPPSAPVACEDGPTVRVLLKGRLFAKQGWVFLDDANERDNEGLPQPHEFTLGRREVIPGLEIGVRGMREGGVRRVVIPPRASYQDKTSEPIPRVFSNRQRLYTTIFNPTRLANGEGDTLSTVIFDIELVKVKA